MDGVLYALTAFQNPSDRWNASSNKAWITALNHSQTDALHLGDGILAIEGVNIDSR